MRCAPVGVALAWAAALGFSCARNVALDSQVDRIGQLLLDAEASGAMRCAPREMAVARSQLEFATLEHEQGFTSRAEQHLLLADQHARAALLLSPATHCRPVPPVESSE
jgi:OmpA-OmpF porin, OOP family